MHEQKKAVVIGATGLIGSQLVELLLKDSEYHQVIIIVRKMPLLTHDKLQVKVLDFQELPQLIIPEGADYFCCLGTTIQQAKTQNAFSLVDHDYPLQFAQLAKKYNAKSFHIITAYGSDKNSKIFYSRIKGELEDKLKQLKLNKLRIYHPSLLIGERTQLQQATRRGEKLTQKIYQFIAPVVKKLNFDWLPIEGRLVAEAMQKEAHATSSEAIRIVYRSSMNCNG